MRSAVWAISAVAGIRLLTGTSLAAQPYGGEDDYGGYGGYGDYGGYGGDYGGYGGDDGGYGGDDGGYAGYGEPVDPYAGGGEDPYGGDPGVGSGYDPGATGFAVPPSGGTTPAVPTTFGSFPEATARVALAGTATFANTAGGPDDGGHRVGDALYCDGIRYPLEEEREDTGPARLVRLRELTRSINVVGRAMDPDRCGGSPEGECLGLRKAVERAQFSALELFQSQQEIEACMLDPIATWNEQEGRCQELRQRMSDLRAHDREALARAEYVLAVRLCDNAGALDAGVRAACQDLREALAPHDGTGVRPAFWLDAPLPRRVQETVRKIRLVTGGNFDVDALSSDLARDFRCQTAGGDAAPDGSTSVGYLTGLCREYELLRRVSDACRLASVYVDERGEVHAAAGLDRETGRGAATLCVDVSDFAPDAPLLVNVRLGAEGSRPIRVWPGEPIFIGQYLAGPVASGDVAAVEVRGKAWGISLAETLRVNGVAPGSPDACRIARANVPVVDHEIPIGGADQKVIPASFHSGRVGETGTVYQGDSLMIWVRDIEPSGAVRVEYGDPDGPQYVGYIPPPLLGQTEQLTPAQQQREGMRPPGAHLRPSAVGIDQPLVPRRARYPGSRVLRLGHPAGFFEYPIAMCTYSSERAAGGTGPVPSLAPAITSCTDPRTTTVLSERLYVHGRYYFGVRAGITGSWFPVRRMVARQTPDALRSGADVWQIQLESEDVFDFDVSVLLAIYPFGRDPYLFDYRFWDFADGHYWNDVALLVGFGLVRIGKDPFADVYAGLSLPLYSGVSFSVLAHFQRRDVPVGVRAGDMFEWTGSSDPDIGDAFGSESQFITGVAFGLSLDYDLFERAFKAIYNHFAPVPAMRSAGRGWGYGN